LAPGEGFRPNMLKADGGLSATARALKKQRAGNALGRRCGSVNGSAMGAELHRNLRSYALTASRSRLDAALVLLAAQQSDRRRDRRHAQRRDWQDPSARPLADAAAERASPQLRVAGATAAAAVATTAVAPGRRAIIALRCGARFRAGRKREPLLAARDRSRRVPLATRRSACRGLCLLRQYGSAGIVLLRRPRPHGLSSAGAAQGLTSSPGGEPRPTQCRYSAGNSCPIRIVS